MAGPRKSLKSAVGSNDELAEIDAMRRHLAATIASGDAQPRDLPPLTKRLRELTLEYQSVRARLEEEEKKTRDESDLSLIHGENIVEGNFDIYKSV